LSFYEFFSFKKEQLELFETLRKELVDPQREWSPSSDPSLFGDAQLPKQASYSKETRYQESQNSGSFFSTLFGGESQNNKGSYSKNRGFSNNSQIKAGPKGIYLYGGPGSGKTFCMDIFYQHLDIPCKTRIHYNEFMLSTHHRMHLLRVLLSIILPSIS
jgi:predicted ATPase